MSVMKKSVLPRLAAALFALQAALLFFTLFNLLSFLLDCPVSLFLAILLLLRKRGAPLAIAAALLAAAQLLYAGVLANLPSFLPLWWAAMGPYLAGSALLLALVLVNTVPKLKRLRVWANPLWFLPGGVMLLAAAGNWAYYVYLGMTPLLALQALDSLGCGALKAAGVLLLSWWLVSCAQEDLIPYQQMLGSLLTEEQLEEKSRELGLAGRPRRGSN